MSAARSAVHLHFYLPKSELNLHVSHTTCDYLVRFDIIFGGTTTITRIGQDVRHYSKERQLLKA